MSAYISAFAALDAALGLTAEEKSAVHKLGFAPEVMAARQKRAMWQAARAGLGRHMAYEISCSEYRDHADFCLDHDATLARLNALDDLQMRGVADAMLEDIAAGRSPLSGYDAWRVLIEKK